ncbi:hypothetical protein AcW1_009470 [Taiwanofungus camphoratus]|nr:hypothetical protein AcW1_009470 [Antrodia cinnamomea]
MEGLILRTETGILLCHQRACTDHDEPVARRSRYARRSLALARSQAVRHVPQSVEQVALFGPRCALGEDEGIQADPKVVVHCCTFGRVRHRATNYTGKSSLPWWALTVILMIGFFFCSLYATPVATIGFTGNAIGFFEMITAYLVPGNPVANMYGALYGG